MSVKMTINVNEILAQLGNLQSLVATLAKQGLPDEFYLKLQSDPQFRERFIVWAQEELSSAGRLVAPDPDHNPFMLSVEEQISRLRRANTREGWGISEKILRSLKKSAPEWPKGRRGFRSLRIRMGQRQRGMCETIQAHLQCAKGVFEKDILGAEEDILPLLHRVHLTAGNETHRPTVEWTTFDIVHQRVPVIRQLRGPRSLADELLVFMWLFPEYIRQIDNKTNHDLIAAGYKFDFTDADACTYLWPSRSPSPRISLVKGRPKIRLDNLTSDSVVLGYAALLE